MTNQPTRSDLVDFLCGALHNHTPSNESRSTATHASGVTTQEFLLQGLQPRHALRVAQAHQSQQETQPVDPIRTEAVSECSTVIAEAVVQKSGEPDLANNTADQAEDQTEKTRPTLEHRLNSKVANNRLPLAKNRQRRPKHSYAGADDENQDTVLAGLQSTETTRRIVIRRTAWVVSAFTHLFTLVVGAWWVTQVQERTALIQTIEQQKLIREDELPLMVELTEFTPAKKLNPENEDILATGISGSRNARPDTGQSGHGGEEFVDKPAVMMSDSIDGLSLTRDGRTHIELTQVHRQKTSRHRSSNDDRTALAEPMELTFIAMGNARNPSRSPQRSAFGGRGAGIVGTTKGANNQGAPLLQDGQGLPPRIEGGPQGGIAGTGAKGKSDSVNNPDSAPANPSGVKGADAAHANEKGRTQDDKTAEQESASSDPSLVQASTAGGKEGHGKGGENSPNPTPGSGAATGSGSQSSAYGDGNGSDPSLAGRADYIRKAIAKIKPYWDGQLPSWAQLEGRHGRTIITFTVNQQGQLTSIAVTRSSNIPEYDEKCRQAVLKGAPFGPLPAILGSSYTMSLPFDAINRTVR